MNYSLLRESDISNGPGIRVSLFVSGCNFHCYNCFNVDAQKYDNGQLYTIDTQNRIINLVSRKHISGLSILGGDPLCQNEQGLFQLIELVHKIKCIPNKTVWLWSGFTFEDILNAKDQSQEDKLRAELVKSCDILVDGTYIDKLKDHNLKWRGSYNQRIIDTSDGSIQYYT